MSIVSMRFNMTIGGERVAAEKTFGVINPATGTVFAEAPDCTNTQLDAAMTAAAGAFRSWSKDEGARRQALKDCAEAIDAHADEIARIQTLEQGKPLQASLGEVGGAHTGSENLPHFLFHMMCCGTTRTVGLRSAASRWASSAQSRRGTTPYS